MNVRVTRLHTSMYVQIYGCFKKKHLNIVKSNKIAQIPVNSEKVWVLGGGGGYHIYIYIWMFPKIMVPPNHPFVHRVFHYFHHPFWGTSIFGSTPIYI